MNILITGGAGYIGSHVCIEVLESGYNPIVVDNLCNSSIKSIERIEALFNKKIHFYKLDIRNFDALSNIFQKHSIDFVMHFAGLKAVGDSIVNPVEYYDSIINGSLSLIKAMIRFNCKNIIYSSSATVYGSPDSAPINESFDTTAINPYGQSKLTVEKILEDLYRSNPSWRVAILRYFNPVGAHESGMIGEDPAGIPNNIMPYISQVATGKLEKVKVFGGDYNTPDGTGVRDYIHVVDLSKGHISALKKISTKPQILILNLGVGIGYSVIDLIKSFEKSCNCVIPYEIVERRPGDVATCYSDPTKANSILKWKADYKIDRMCDDVWRWQLMNPNGYK